MKTKPLFGAVPVVFALLTGCNWNSPVSPIFPMGMEHAGVQMNGEIVNDLMTIDKAEIAAAKVAMKRAQHVKVKRYAEYVHAEHTKCLHKLEHFSHKHGIMPVTSFTATNLANHGKLELVRLETLSGSAFDQAYIADAIQDHKAALQLIDDAIVKSTNPKLTHVLKEVRHHIERHLHRAEAIQKDLVR